MRLELDPSDRSLLIISGVLLVVFSLVSVLLAPERGSGPSNIPSTYSTSSAGAKAAYLLLESLGYKEERWTSPPSELPRKAHSVILILADPLVPPSAEEKTAIQWFVRRGGKVVATGPLAANLLGLPGIVLAKQPGVDWSDFPAKVPGPISRRAPSVLMKASARWKGGPPEDLEYYGDREGGTVVRFPLGKGAIIWWAGSSPLSNYGLTKTSNLNLLLNSVGRPEGVRILWDEYFHGERAGLWTYLEKTPLPWALLQVAILAVAVIMTYSRRSGPVAAPAGVSRLSPMEFVETLGDLYARKRAAAGAVEIALHRFRSLLARRLGRAPDAAVKPLNQAFLKQLGPMERGLASDLAQGESALKAGIRNEAQALRIVQELHEDSRRLRLAGKGD